MSQGNFVPTQLGDLSVPAGWFPITAGAGALAFRCRQLYNGSNAVVTVTFKTESNPVAVAMQIPPYGYLDGYFTHVTVVSTPNVVFGAQ